MILSNQQSLQTIFTKYFEFKNDTRALEPLIEVFKVVRKHDFNDVLSFLKANTEITENFTYYIHNIFRERHFNISLTEANILSENGFFPELKKRILNSVLPNVENENSIWYLFDNISIRPHADFKFLASVPEEKFFELMQLLGFEKLITQKFVKNELYLSANVLAWRAIGNALDVEIINMAPEYKDFDNPFMALQDELDILTAKFQENPDFTLHSKEEHYKQIRIYLTQCHNFIDTAYKNVDKKGISGKINLSLLKIRQQLNRISEIIDLLIIDEEKDILSKGRKLIYNIIEYKSHKNNIAELFNDSTRLISHLITNHTAETGRHYIAANIKDFVKMFWKASGGGVIVGFLCVLKMLYSYGEGSEFSHAFMYAFNYAMGFIIIYLMGYTLATKQPAMTASTMAKVLSEGNNNKPNYREFSHLIAQLSRTQFIAFVGNVLWAFPVSLVLIYGLDVLLNHNLSAAKSSSLLKDLNPLETSPFLHASIAGVYLFISGIISGNIGNNSVYYRIPERIAKNPTLRLVFGTKVAENLSKFYKKNWAGIASNFWFGVCLGVTGSIGKFLGLDLDIRHITFAAGNFALGLYGKDFEISLNLFLVCVATIGLIGFFNFIVSFGLSMILALRSRKVSLGRTGDIFKDIFTYFIEKPLIFFFPIPSKEMDERVNKVIGRNINE
ncbi:recombinase [Bergeyella zoohelcum]|uniref:Site-specific recombinase n=1 Tax=Bergeyella zoohelcum TaxID=1015 RepID=A0A380ZV15_9FLAO|nr:recombinase [Bergeyella zoohelcum]EKB59523.1 hypothetical protein HMPREF9700_01534 [Bergeyella zoohelcum CCUG 30536]SUV52596.1 Site-specific recombinase [Bergeyella zoohelcum]VDH05896.1 Site-specific recombinase [Bergeyella zoohelcum]